MLHDATLAIFEVRRKLATMFNPPKENVGATSHFVVGGFGDVHRR